MTAKKFIRMNVYSRVKAVTAPFECANALRKMKEPKINIGAGKNILSDWLNVDLYPNIGAVRMDAGRRWPFNDGIFVAALCEHMIEHIPRKMAEHLLAEAWRTLRPEGVIRIVTPDLTKFGQFVVNSDSTELQEYRTGLERFYGHAVSTCDAVNQIFYGHGHCYIYSPDELGAMLTTVGFRDIAYLRGGQYGNPIFNGVDGHPKVVGTRFNEIEAFAIEARRSS